MKKIFVFAFCIFLISSFTFLSAESPTSETQSAEEAALTFFKKLNETQKKLTYMNKKSSLAKIGTETINGNISGTLFYDVKIQGVGALVTLRYTNYCDEDGWIFDGEIITNSNMSQNGTFSGTVKMTAPLNSGTPSLDVCYDNVLLKKGAPGAGYYLVNYTGGEAEKVDYSVYLKSLTH